MKPATKITKSVYTELVHTAENMLPAEACGFLAGKNGIITDFYPLTNADNSPDHYTMIPEEQFAAVKDIRSKGLTLYAIWHSHPETEARMSKEDIKLAYMPDVLYAILSLALPEEPSLRAFEMIEDSPNERILSMYDHHGDIDD